MRFLNFLQSVLIILTFLFILSLIFFLYTIIKGYNYTGNLGKKVNSLGKGITPEKVEEFIVYLDAKYIPFRFYTINLIKAGYRLVEMDGSIDVGLKQRLKIMILSKGILVD